MFLKGNYENLGLSSVVVWAHQTLQKFKFKYLNLQAHLIYMG